MDSGLGNKVNSFIKDKRCNCKKTSLYEIDEIGLIGNNNIGKQMKLKLLVKSLRSQIEIEKDCGNSLDSIDWGMQEGVLLSVNDLEELLDAVEKRLS